MSKPRCLITGASGFLGWNLCKEAAKKWEVFGTYNSTKIGEEFCKSGRCDLEDYQETAAVLDHVKPEVVFHLAAISNPNACAEDPRLSEKINFESSFRLAEMCADRGIKFLFTSTDLVFDGLHGNYRESDPVNPVNHYGEHKAMAEEAILALNSAAVICRMPLMYGKSSIGRKSFLELMIGSLLKKEKLKLFTDEFRSIASASCASTGMISTALNASGLIHLGGPERLSRIAMGEELVAHMRVSSSLIKACQQKDLKFKAARPADVSLNSQQAFDLGYSPLTFSAALKEQF